MLLRSVKEENIVDEERSRLMLLAQEEKMKQQLGRIKTLESFIIEQDEVSFLQFEFTSINCAS